MVQFHKGLCPLRHAHSGESSSGTIYLPQHSQESLNPAVLAFHKDKSHKYITTRYP